MSKTLITECNLRKTQKTKKHLSKQNIRWFQPKFMDVWFYLSFLLVSLRGSFFWFWNQNNLKTSWKKLCFHQRVSFHLYSFLNCLELKNYFCSIFFCVFHSSTSRKKKWNDSCWWKTNFSMIFFRFFDSKTKKQRPSGGNQQTKN